MKRIEIKSAAEVATMRKGGVILRDVVRKVCDCVKPGVTTGELDRIAHDLIVKAGSKPACLGYHGYPATLCTSVNAEVVHGIPGGRVLVEGDIVTIDCAMIHDGFVTDHAFTVGVGEITPEARKLLDVTRESLDLAIPHVLAGGRVGDISAAVQAHVEANGFSVIREYTGHGVGRAMHEAPQVPNFGSAGTGTRLKAGIVLAIEPMVNAGTWRTRTLKDGWTVVTMDGSLSAHFEHTVAVTDDGPLVLTA